MTRLTLEAISQDLFDIFEDEINFQQGVPTKSSLEERTGQYLLRTSKEAEIGGDLTSHLELTELSKAVNKDILPAYTSYSEKKKEIKKNREKNGIGQYVWGAILGLNVVEAVLTKGRSLHPGVILATGTVESLLGYTAYRFALFGDALKLNKAEKQFFKTVDYAQKRFVTEKRHRDFVDITNGDMMEVETNHLLSKYESQQKFWDDYNVVKKVDPTTDSSFETLNVPNFESFLSLHLNGVYSSQIRGERLNRLFVKAHEHFVKTN